VPQWFKPGAPRIKSGALEPAALKPDDARGCTGLKRSAPDSRYVVVATIPLQRVVKDT
jgi:hypothetical protein